VRRIGLALTIVLAAGCAQTPATNRSAMPGSNMVQAGWVQASQDLDAVGFDCARAADSPQVLRATAGPGVTHAQVLAQCGQRLGEASAHLQVYDRALVKARDLPLMERERLHALAGRLAGLLDQAKAAVGADDMATLSTLRQEIASVEGQMLAAGA